MSHAGFVHLRVRSAFSLLESTVRHGELAAACRKGGMPAVAVTDTANLFGAMQFCAAAKKAGVQPILGALMALAQAEGAAPASRATAPGRQAEPEHLVLLVKDATGYGNLLHLMSEAHVNHEPGAPVQVTLEDLVARNAGLILLAGGACGPVGAALRRGDRKGAERLLLDLKAAFGDRLYVELQRHGEEVEAAAEEGLLGLAYRHDVHLVATNDVHFLTADMHEAHDALLCIATGARIAEDNRRRLTPEHRFKTAAEMAELFADLPEAVANTLVIARRCAFMAPGRDPILPTFARDEEAEMRRQAASGLEARLRHAVWTEGMDDAQRDAAAKPYRERLEYELGVIAQMRFPGYFLIVSDFIKWAKARGIPVGPGRGSGAGSVVAWSLEITDLDPLRFGLLFERFLNPERVSMPDFDIDFCEERRDEVIRYVSQRYGEDRVAQIITFGTLQPRAALRDIGRVMGLPFGLVDRTCKLVPQNPANPVSLAQALEMEPRLKEAREQDEGVGRMVDIALKLEGLPRHASTHAAGVVIGDRPLCDLVPLYRDPRALMAATQFNMKDVEKAGLVKFDFLGLSTLTMLRLAEDLVKARGVDLKLDALPLDDTATYELLARAETTGVFQLESPGMRDALRKLKPDSFGDIIALVSLYRPGPMDNIPRYTNVKHGIEDPRYLHPLLRPILEETNGVIIYQEQVMEIAQRLAGYTLGGADLLRRAMGKKIKAEMDAQRDVFVQGCVGCGIKKDLATTIFDLVAKFASYGFNKSHAAAYAILAYQTAYLKANHPVEFFAAAMTIEMANQDKLAAFRQEMRARGVPLYPPDINASGVRFAPEDGERGLGVRYALSAIKGVGQQAVQSLVEEREAGGPFTCAYDLGERMGPRWLNKRLLESLVRAGALDRVHPCRRSVTECAEQIMRHAAAAAQGEADPGQASLFGGGEGGVSARPPKPKVLGDEDWPSLERLQNEFDVLGLYLSAHPLDGYAGALVRLNVASGDRLRQLAGAGEGSRIKLAGVVVAKQERVTEKTRLARVVLSDATAQFEVTVFSELLAESRELLDGKAPLLIEADARVDGDMLRITAQRIQPLDEAHGIGKGAAVEIRLADAAAAARLRPLLERRAKGGARVRLVVPVRDGGSRDGEEAVVALPEGFLLGSGQRVDVERMEGVLAVRDVDYASVALH